MNNKEIVKKKIFVRTFGCQMQDRDSEAVVGLFLQRGYALADDPKSADVILVNTCSVRLHAEDRAISFLGSLKNLSREGRRMKGEGRKNLIPHPSSLIPRVIGLIGCMAKTRGQEIAKRMPHVNLICSPAAEDRIVEYVERLINDGRGTKDEGRRGKDEGRRMKDEGCKKIIDLEDRRREEKFYSTNYRIEPNQAQVVISTGCSNRCAYCIVPAARGELRLRKPGDIIAEVKRNVDLGITKITLLGQNVNDYSYKVKCLKCLKCEMPKVKEQEENNINFVDLLKKVADINGVEEIDFLTSHPKNTSPELFKLMAGHPKIKKHLHLPFQSGSDRILKAMGRGYTREKYLSLVESYKKITGEAIGTDIIVGFPGETEEDFLETRDVVEKAQFNYAYIFTYSPRPGTAAAKLTDDVPLEEKKRRHGELLALQKKIAKERKQNFFNTEYLESRE